MPISPEPSNACDVAACSAKARWELRLRADRAPYVAEWKHCAQKHTELGDFGVDTIVVRDRESHVAWCTSNRDEPWNEWIESVEPTQFGTRGEDQLFVLTRIAGTGHAWNMCVLGQTGQTGSGIGCWPVERADALSSLLPEGERLHNCQASLRPIGLEYECGISAENDPNCCPSRGVVHAQARSGDGAFAIERVWRTAE